MQDIYVSLPQVGSPWKTTVWISPKSNLVNQRLLLGSLRGIWVRVYLQQHKWPRDSCIIKVHPRMGTAHKSWEPEAQGTAHRQLNRLESLPSRCLHRSESVQVDKPVSAAFRLLSWFLPGTWAHQRATLKSHYCSLLGEREPSQSGQLQGLAEALLNVSLAA